MGTPCTALGSESNPPVPCPMVADQVDTRCSHPVVVEDAMGLQLLKLATPSRVRVARQPEASVAPWSVQDGNEGSRLQE